MNCSSEHCLKALSLLHVHFSLCCLTLCTLFQFTCLDVPCPDVHSLNLQFYTISMSWCTLIRCPGVHHLHLRHCLGVQAHTVSGELVSVSSYTTYSFHKTLSSVVFRQCMVIRGDQCESIVPFALCRINVQSWNSSLARMPPDRSEIHISKNKQKNSLLASAYDLIRSRQNFLFISRNLRN